MENLALLYPFTVQKKRSEIYIFMNSSTEFNPIFFPDRKFPINQQIEMSLFHAKQRVLRVEQAEKNAALCPKKIIRHSAALCMIHFI